MIEALAQIAPMGVTALWTGFVVFIRIGAMMALVPAFGEQNVPMRVRLGVTLAFVLIVLPAAPGLPAQPAASAALTAIILAEAATGLFMGLMLRLFVIALQIAGTIAAQSTSLSQLFGGSTGVDPLPAIGNVLLVAGLALATLLGLHVRLAEYMIYSYELIPAGQFPSPAVVSAAGLAEVGHAFALAFTLAAPFVIASLIYNVTLGVINRAMPQLMVSFVGAPAITAGGLILLFVSAPILLSIWVDAFGDFMIDPFGTLR
ncbi:MAG: flagellar biosynthetic protein FliR [Paracoccaceae bacterium]|jgi:flagellar biosynthetic protein FliR